MERPVDDLTTRRVKFYERMGLRLYDHPYLHPAFHKNGQKIEVCMVSCGDIDLEKEFDRIETYLYKYVYPRKEIAGPAATVKINPKDTESSGRETDADHAQATGS